jgi:glycosyltransferase involved in cell wall biosynthesis
MPLVSVVMTSYQYDRYIAEAIDSVLNQTMCDLELIIVDDGSTDQSHQIIQSYAKKDHRVKPVLGTVNRGIGHTMNTGIEMATGEFIAFISSDDRWLPDKLEIQLKILENNKDLVVWTEGTIIDAQGKPTGTTFSQVHNTEQRKKSGNIFKELLKGNMIFGSSRILRRSNVQEIRWNEDLKYLCDYQFAVDLAWRYDYYFIQEPLSQYRIHGMNTVTRDLFGHLKEYIPLGRYFLSRYGDIMENQSRVGIYDRSVAVLTQQLDHGKVVQGRAAALENENNRIKSSFAFRILSLFQKKE